MQRLASDFLSNYIFLSVGRVGSSTDLIAQRVEFVPNMDKRNHLMNLLRGQEPNGTHGKVDWLLLFKNYPFLCFVVSQCWLSIRILLHGWLYYLYDKCGLNCYHKLLIINHFIFWPAQHALTLIFVETKRGADALEHWLSLNGFPAIAIHGDKVQMVSSNSLSFNVFMSVYQQQW